MENFVVEVQILFDFILLQNNWIVSIVLGLALLGLVDGVTRLCSAILPWNKPVAGPTGPMGVTGEPGQPGTCCCRSKNKNKIDPTRGSTCT